MLALKRYENPLLTAVSVFESWARSEPKYLYSAWRVFAGYVTAKYVEQGSVRNYVERAEKGAGSIVGKLVADRTPSDDLVEAGTLVYFVLASEGVERRYGVGEALRKAFTACIEDIVNVDPMRSPALSRCLGLSYVLQPIDPSVETLGESCLSGSAEGLADFCTYAFFAKTLSALLRGDKSVAESVEKWVARSTKTGYMPVHLLALNMISYGLASVIVCEGKKSLATKMKLFDKLNKRLLKELNPHTIRRFNKHVWVILRLAIVANKLRRVEYVPEGYIVLPKVTLTEVLRMLKKFKRAAYIKDLVIGLFIAILSAASPFIGISQHLLALVGLFVGILLASYRFVLKLLHINVEYLINELEKIHR